MAKPKRYFWLKLKEDFFNQKEIKLLRKIAGGDTYTIIYLKMLLLSLKNDGKIYFDGLTDEFSEEIALEIDESVDNVTVTLQFLQSKGLIAFDNDNQDEFELTNIASMIGSETDKAAMMRRKRAREKREIGNNVTQVLPDRYTEIEIEKELEIEKETDRETEKNYVSRPSSFETYENGGYGFLNPIMMQKLIAWMEDFGDEGDAIVSRALEIGIESNKRSYNYVNGILKNWYSSKLLTIAAIEAKENERTANKKADKPMSTQRSDEEMARLDEINRKRIAALYNRSSGGGFDEVAHT